MNAWIQNIILMSYGIVKQSSSPSPTIQWLMQPQGSQVQQTEWLTTLSWIWLVRWQHMDSDSLLHRQETQDQYNVSSLNSLSPGWHQTGQTTDGTQRGTQSSSPAQSHWQLQACILKGRKGHSVIEKITLNYSQAFLKAYTEAWKCTFKRESVCKVLCSNETREMNWKRPGGNSTLGCLSLLIP